jgi:hypothetical protein
MRVYASFVGGFKLSKNFEKNIYYATEGVMERGMKDGIE